MAAQGSLPVWLLDGKEEITKSKEWDTFLQDLYDAIQQQLNESHIQLFTDLSDAERNLFIEKATRAISGSSAYTELFSRVSKSLDRQLNNEVSRQLLEDFPVSTKTDLVIESAQDGIVSLLKKWPNMRSKLIIYFNQPLSDAVRPVAWKAFLENGKVRKQYVKILSSNPRASISSIDREISKTIEHIINMEPNCDDFKGSIGAFYAMKAVLSYFHAVNQPKTERLPDAFFYLILPFVFLELPNISRKEPASSQVVASIMEEYFTLVASLPGYVTELMNEGPEDQIKIFTNRVTNRLSRINPDLATAISDAFVPRSENIVATETGNRAVLDDVTRILMKPVIRNMFACHVNREVLLYIWDQYVIGLDSPGFTDDYLPAVSAVFLTLLSDKLKTAESPGQLEMSLRKDGRKLTVAQFQYEMNKYFYKELYARLNHDDRPILPVLDPTQANFPPWVNWFAQSQIPSHMSSEERKRVRDEREAERLRLLQKKRDELERRRKDEEERVFKQQAQLHKEDRNVLENELDKERGRRQEMERSAAEEIERLRMEIEDLKNYQQRRPPSVSSLTSAISHFLIPPPPSLVTSSKPGTPLQTTPLPPAQTMVKTPEPSSVREKQTTDAILDIVTKVSQSFHRVTGGEGYQKLDLDNSSKEAIVSHRNDVKQAEIEVFGHELKPGEFEHLPRELKEEKSKEILDIIRRRITDRRRENLRNGFRH